MFKNKIKSYASFFIHFSVIVFFALVALLYFYPVLQDKAIEQSDIVQYTGMAKEQNNFRAQNGEEPYWTNSAFGGMPTYQLGAQFPHNYVKKLDRLVRFLPRPADYMFLYFIGFYLLLCSLKIDYRIAILGALAYGFSTYFIIILGVGHNAKAHALGYIPIVLAGIIWAFDKKYWLGFCVTALGMALEIVANHVQMTYYFMLLVLVLGVVYLWYAYKEKLLAHYFKTVGILIGAVLLGIAANATVLLATKEYAAWSTRGASPITITPEGSPKTVSSGLDKDYITYYSYGPLESLNLLVPRLTGGSFKEALGNNAATYKFLLAQGVSPANALSFSNNLPLYWGPQPPTSGPAYLGAVVLALFFIGAFLYQGKVKWVFIISAIFTLMLSWGKFFMPLSNLMIDYFPLYNKFRAVSSIQVIVALCVPALASLGLHSFFSKEKSNAAKLKVVKQTALFFGGLLSIIFLSSFILDYQGQSDSQIAAMYGDEILAVLKQDRALVFRMDTLRSFALIASLLAVLWVSIKKEWKQSKVLFLLALLLLIDLFGIGKRYVNAENFVPAKQMQQPFIATAMDKEIKKDTSIFRVYDMSEGLNGARTSYFHKSIGGYHAAKPEAIMALFDFHIYKSHLEILHLLNVKYVVQVGEQGTPTLAINSNANGNAWFVKELISVANHNQWIQGLNQINTKTQATLLNKDYQTLAQTSFVVDTVEPPTIILKDYSPNRLVYMAQNSKNGFAVFSEMYYAHGWEATINGTPTPIFKVDYALRGIKVPAGDHEIVFEFKPKVVAIGSNIALGSTILLCLCIGFGCFKAWKHPIKSTKGVV